jgi:rRNA maturation RNase YbeY
MLTFVLINDRKMAALHRKYSGIPGTTDVLTFDLTEGESAPIDGDIYICIDQARRQSAERKIPLHREVARLAVHGVLHLAGFSDTTDAQQAEMRRLEDRSLNAGEGRH